MGYTRRSFLAWLGTLPLLFRARGSPALGLPRPPGPVESQPRQLDPVLLHSLAEAVLPSELGAAGIGAAVTEYRGWIAEYRAGAELLHPYGSAEIRYAEELPLAKWRDQLLELDRVSRARYGQGFSELERDRRAEIVRAALSGEARTVLPAPADASHVAISLLAFFCASAAATNLCYRARIDPLQCRPLSDAPRRPLPLASIEGARPPAPAPGLWQEELGS
ncbi:MAG TPA: hypothetical protein VNL96_10880 [Gemmatimonadaceae bacterium]|nr:hypothetical protein [Gemmatimonadaceae bacterium]